LQTTLPCVGCGSTCRLFSAAQGTFTDGSGDADYSSDASCEWIIAPKFSDQIIVWFTEFSTQADYDTVLVSECIVEYCKDAGAPKRLALLSGINTTSQVMSSTTGYVKVAFRSDSSITAAGFSVSWSSVSSV
jgi:hypothetical protein